ncbi:hypothetical protein KM043_006934 [Ampulex compressa]|nr:hypothetical protein KM043_006934 [Ampulex compressa]
MLQGRYSQNRCILYCCVYLESIIERNIRYRYHICLPSVPMPCAELPRVLCIPLNKQSVTFATSIFFLYFFTELCTIEDQPGSVISLALRLDAYNIEQCG